MSERGKKKTLSNEVLRFLINVGEKKNYFGTSVAFVVALVVALEERAVEELP